MDAPWNLDWTKDPAFLWVAAGQFLLALGVREETVRPLGELRPLYEKWDEHLDGGADGGAAATPIPTARTLTSLSRRERAELDDDLGRALAILLPVVEEALEQLDRRRIRTETMGVRREALDGAVSDLRDYAASEGWRGQDEQAIETHLRWIADRPEWKTPLRKPERGEVGRIVDVLVEVPRPTLRRIAGVSNRPALMALVGGWFSMVHSGVADDGTPVEPELVSNGPDPLRDALREMERRDAELDAQLARNKAEREWQWRRFEHRGALLTWMGIVGGIPTVALVLVIAVGAVLPLAGRAISMTQQVLPMAGAVSAAIGVVAMLVLLLMAFTGSRRTTEDQRSLRAATAGGMLILMGLLNFTLGMFPLMASLTEPPYRTAGILGGVLVVLGIAVSLIGAVQRTRAQRRAGLPEDDIPLHLLP